MESLNRYLSLTKGAAGVSYVREGFNFKEKGPTVEGRERGRDCRVH